MKETDNARKEFCDALRRGATQLAEGKESIFIKQFDIEYLLGESAQGINQSYIRTIMNRVPIVKAIGSVRIKRVSGSDEMPDGYEVTLNREPKRKVITNEDLPEIKARAVRKFAERILGFMPNVMDLEGDERDGAIKGIARYQDMIKAMINDE